MIKFSKLFIISISIFLIILLAVPKSTRAQFNFTKIIDTVRTITGFIKSVTQVNNTFDSWVPHSFPFGGPILSSQRACTLEAWIWVCTPFGCFPCVNCPLWFFSGRAIEVGPPVPSGGKINHFPWISDIYDQHAENRAGPWALGLGFTPFPMEQINDGLGSLRIPYPAGWIDHIHFDCTESGETDPQGNDIYKIILKLGTSRDDVPASTLQNLKQKFPGFLWP